MKTSYFDGQIIHDPALSYRNQCQLDRDLFHQVIDTFTPSHSMEL